MKIEIDQDSDTKMFRADCRDLPGTPPVGRGITKEYALAVLFWRMAFTETGGRTSQKWLDFIDPTQEIIIDDRVTGKQTRQDTILT